MLLTRQTDDENVSITVLIHSNNSIKYDVSSGGARIILLRLVKLIH